jgi:hypothetical protein
MAALLFVLVPLAVLLGFIALAYLALCTAYREAERTVEIGRCGDSDRPLAARADPTADRDRRYSRPRGAPALP